MANHNIRADLKFNVAFGEDDLSRFLQLVSDQANFGHPVKELIFRGTSLEVNKDTLTEVLEMIRTRTPHLTTVRLLWDVDTRWENEAREMWASRMNSVVQSLHNRENVLSVTNNMLPSIQTLVLEKVTWDLFQPEYVPQPGPSRNIYTCLRHLHISFDMEMSILKLSDKPGYRGLGEVLRKCDQLKVLHLHFQTPKLQQGSIDYGKPAALISPRFKDLVGDTHYKALEELSLSHVVLDPDFAVDFFRRHSPRLKTVNLLSLRESPEIVSAYKPLWAALVNLQLRSILLRGRWTYFSRSSDGGGFRLLEWVESNEKDFAEMRKAEQDILQREKINEPQSSRRNLKQRLRDLWERVKCRKQKQPDGPDDTLCCHCLASEQPIAANRQ